ncbi:MAG: hypothetical protein ACHQPI_08850 [Thermoanaerobaculia bacterium]
MRQAIRNLSREGTALAVALALLVWTTACYDKKILEMAPPDRPVESRILSVTTVDGDVLTFEGNVEFLGETLVGTVAGKQTSLPVSKVQRYVIEQKKLNAWKTVGVVIGAIVLTAGILVAIAAATKQSCPFVYSWDGTQYVFDAEPYGGAITRGLERDDDTVLDHLRADAGLYRLLLTNEVDETQYTNALWLRVVDHAPGVRIVPGTDGTLRTVRAPVPPRSARTADGRNLTRWLAASDRLIFEPVPNVGPSGETRDEIVLTFPKPEGAREAKLVVNAGTALFGSYMIKESLRLYGRDLSAWYEAMDRDPEATAALHEKLLQEELWALKLDVEEPTGWETRGKLIGTGPLIVKDRVVPLDVSRVVGDELRVRIRPPRGFWALDSFAVDYSADEPFHVTDVPLLAARDGAGRDRRSALLAADDEYDELPVGSADRVALTFPVPAHEPGLDRTVVLHSRGWYRLNLASEGEPDHDAIRRFENEQGFGVRLAAERYARWQAGVAASVSPGR